MPSDPTTPKTFNPAAAAPWLIALGVVGVSVAVAGGPAPLLTCLLLVAIGSDVDLRRRFDEAEALSGGPGLLSSIATPLLTLHAAMYAGLYLLAWGALLDLSDSAPSGRAPLLADLVLSLVVLVGYARKDRRWNGT